MRIKTLDDGPPCRLAVVFETGDTVIETLTRLAGERGQRAAHFSGMGAFQDATLGYFDWESREYRKIVLDEQVEVLSLAGNVTLYEGQPRVHAHAVIGRRDGAARGGHLLEAHVRPTLELILVESSSALRRVMSPEARIPLIDPSR